MIGEGRAVAYCAGTIVNAIPTGNGAAFALDLPVEVSVTLHPMRGRLPALRGFRTNQPEAGPELVLQNLRTTLDRIGMWADATVRVKSPLPPSRGFKTSSAVSNATVLATSEAAGMFLEPEDALDLGVDAALAAGVTLTGAFDDAAASLLGCVVLTNNTRRRIVMACAPASARLGATQVHLLIPSYGTPKRSLRRGQFAGARRKCAAAFRQATAGDAPGAITANGEAIAAAVGLSTLPSDAALSAGAIAAGVTGTGPAVIAVSRRNHSRVRRALRKFGQVITTRPGTRPGGLVA